MIKCEKLRDLNKITINDLQAGDIILYHGKGIVAFLIRFFDGSHVSHAGIYTGEKTVIEAVGEGIKEEKLLDSIGKKHNRYVVIKRLKSAPGDMRPVIDIARKYLENKNKYEYKSIFLLIIISLVGRIHGNNPVAWLVTKILKQYFSRCMKNDENQRMICSELTYRCYNEAKGSLGKNYSFLVDTMPMIRSVYTAGCESSLVDRKNLVGTALKAADVKKNNPQKELTEEKFEEVVSGMCRFTRDTIIKEENEISGDESGGAEKGNYMRDLLKTIPHFVTPRDILCSPSLTSKGFIVSKEIDPSEK